MAQEPTHGEILKELAALSAKVDRLADDVSETKAVVEAWDAIKTGSKAVAWLAKTVAAVLVLWAAIKLGAGALVDLGTKG